MNSVPLTCLGPAVDEGQLVPPVLDEGRFRHDQRRLLDALHENGIDVKLYASAFNPYPFAVPDERLESLKALQGSIQRAVVAIVTNHRKDDRIRSVIQLSERETQLIEAIGERPYLPGSFRPDFLHAADGRAMVTEINARFPLNGYLSSHVLSRVIPTLYPGLEPLDGMEELPGALRRRLGYFADIGLLKASEAGWDIHILKKWLGVRARMVHLPLLTPTQIASWGSVILELNQHELLNELPGGVLESLVEHDGLLNDLRTIFIAHDKRLLSLLSTSRVIEDYLEAGDVRRLRDHVIPTYVKGTSPEDRPYGKLGWIMKPPREGKGAGFLLQRQMGIHWDSMMRHAPPDFILQPYVEQMTFPITVIGEEGLTMKPMQVVGLLPSLDDDNFGPGMYRASQDDIVNVARGGTILAPTRIRSSR